MRLPDFFKLGAVIILGLGILKVFFSNFLDIQSQGVQITYWIISGVFATAVVRRGGILHYLEAAFIGFMWSLFCLFFDYFILYLLHLLQPDTFKHSLMWIGYAVVTLSIFFFHKKRHVHIRRGGKMPSHH